MIIRRAKEKDIPEVLRLLSQVLEIHASIRPDIFISGTTKYSAEELAEMFRDEKRPVYVALEEETEGDDTQDTKATLGSSILGYCFCEFEEAPDSVNIVPFTSIYIDDLCVDAGARGSHVGRSLFEYVKAEAKKLGCYEITLNVWEGNDTARIFYEKMGMHPKKTTMEYIL
ncbi:MAG: GNAT family N-acetyltransferase [Lachnospiraceae bacterium]|nr:GNAT family N-acetyltransferase [Lachnospiraceae bacterium]